MSTNPTRPQPKTSQKVLTGSSTKTNGQSKTFKKFLDAGRSNTRVLTRVERYLLTRPRDESRATNVLHPSEMVREDWCHRAAYYLLQGAEPAAEPVTRRGLKTHLVFQMGHAIHDIWQSLFANMGVLHGTWRCAQCGFLSKTINNDPACPLHNKDTRWNYAEVPVKDAERRISGKADGILIGLGEPVLLEIKSMSEGSFIFEDKDAWYRADQNYDKAWKNFSAPFLKHVLQAQLYLKLLEGQEIAPQEILFLYHSKPHNEAKEFTIRKSDFGITEILDAATMVVECVKNGTPPRCNVKGKDLCAKCEVYE